MIVFAERNGCTHGNVCTHTKCAASAPSTSNHPFALPLTNYLVPLVDVIRSGEQNTAAYHFTHDAAHRPDVDVLLVAHAQNDFRRSIVARHHVRRHHERGASSSGQPKVEDFQRAIRLDHNVGRLQILFFGNVLGGVYGFSADSSDVLRDG